MNSTNTGPDHNWIALGQAFLERYRNAVLTKNRTFLFELYCWDGVSKDSRRNIENQYAWEFGASKRNFRFLTRSQYVERCRQARVALPSHLHEVRRGDQVLKMNLTIVGYVAYEYYGTMTGEVIRPVGIKNGSMFLTSLVQVKHSWFADFCQDMSQRLHPAASRL